MSLLSLVLLLTFDPSSHSIWRGCGPRVSIQLFQAKVVLAAGPRGTSLPDLIRPYNIDGAILFQNHPSQLKLELKKRGDIHLGND